MLFAARFINVIFEILRLLIIARVLLSWFRTSQIGPIQRFIIETTDPILSYARRISPRLGMIDLSPIIAIIGLSIIEKILRYLIFG